MKMVSFLFLLLLLTQCEWLKPKEFVPKLPEATQIGANTFGCLVNGQLWLPEGAPMFGGTSVNTDYDPSLSKGFLTITARRFRSPTDRETIGVTIDSARSGIEYTYLPWDGKRLLLLRFSYENLKTKCGIASVDKDTGYDSTLFCSGRVKLTRVDPEVRIVSGIFEYTLYKPGCDTIKVTNGRFDIKL